MLKQALSERSWTGIAIAVVVALADQPDTDAARIRTVVAAWDGQAPLVVAEADGRPSHPVLFARAVFGELRALRGDVGGRAVVERHRAGTTYGPGRPLPEHARTT